MTRARFIFRLTDLLTEIMQMFHMEAIQPIEHMEPTTKIIVKRSAVLICMGNMLVGNIIVVRNYATRGKRHELFHTEFASRVVPAKKL